ncbi:hypothetical protein EV200_109105 [Pedobacter psychrotolerans]|uniref:Uncharacterized protein n=1 Tax=Pedobacter psychrotolerans TaxID=1843235 RepID=A0A4R2H709_9SPHI|nr:hypothetical protein EV200_109105 [Pedobacter psychrotolerans]
MKKIIVLNTGFNSNYGLRSTIFNLKINIMIKKLPHATENFVLHTLRLQICADRFKVATETIVSNM